MKSSIFSGILQTFTRTGPRLGIAFSGGGARGFSHIGVVLALEKFGIRPTVISGVSAGAIAAAMYGAGMTGVQMYECFREHMSMADYRDWIVPRDGFMSLRKFENYLRHWLPVTRLEDMAVPTVICVTDLDRGKSVGLRNGDTAHAVTASCSIPVLFPPVRINGSNYVDGGVLRNLPAWAIRDNCDLLLGSNCNPLDRSYRHKRSLIAIALRSYQLMMKANTLQDLEMCDYVVQNQNLARYSTFSVAEMDKIILDGYDSACSIVEQIANKHYIS